MALPTPQLDDRSFQDIVNEAKGKIAHLCPAWTDHNVSDPGVTLVELFAWMTEMLLYRLNRVPEKSYITFMELMGVRLTPPQPAHTDLTFWLQENAPDTLTIPAGTEVATKQTNAAEPAVTFSTDRALKIVQQPDMLAYLTSADDGASFTAHSLGVGQGAQLRGPDGVLIFGAQPNEAQNGLYLVSRSDIGGHILEVDLTCIPQAAGIQVLDPPLAWEAWCGAWRDGAWRDGGWRTVEWTDGSVDPETNVRRASTNGLNEPGKMILYLPQGMIIRNQQGPAGYWLRCVYRKSYNSQKGYDVSPRISAIRITAIGATVAATQAQTIGGASEVGAAGEVLGYSDGSPGQRFQLQYRPVLALGPGERIQVTDEQGIWQDWSQPEHAHFGFSQRQRHFLLDQANGVIQFGPQIRELDGTQTQYGNIPPRGSQIRITRYRSGGGARGNLPAGKISEPKRTLAFVRSITNRHAATGGRDGETLERARLRAPQELHAVTRAVTTRDYELLAVQADPRGRIARARCHAPTRAEDAQGPNGNLVRVMVVPVDRDDQGHLIAKATLDPELHEVVRTYLDERRLLTSKLEIVGPNYQRVSVLAHIRVRSGTDPKQVHESAERYLNTFLNPLHGGDGSGWAFGRGVYISELYSLLQAIPGVAYIEKLAIRSGGAEISEGVLTIGADQLITPDDHTIVVVEQGLPWTTAS